MGVDGGSLGRGVSGVASMVDAWSFLSQPLRISFDMIDDWELFVSCFHGAPGSDWIDVHRAWLEFQGIPGGATTVYQPPLDVYRWTHLGTLEQIRPSHAVTYKRLDDDI